MDVVRNAALTVDGLTDQQGWQTSPAHVTMSLLLEADQEFPPPNNQIVADPHAKLAMTPFLSGDGIGIVLLVKASDPSTATTLAERLHREFLQMVILHADPVTGAAVQQRVATSGLGGSAWLGSLVTVSAALISWLVTRSIGYGLVLP